MGLDINTLLKLNLDLMILSSSSPLTIVNYVMTFNKNSFKSLIPTLLLGPNILLKIIIIIIIINLEVYSLPL